MGGIYASLGGGGGGRGGVTSITGTTGEVLANGVAGTPETGAVTLTLDSPLLPPGQIQAIDGSQAAPSYAFANAPDSGMWLRSHDPSPGLSIGVGNGEYIRVANFVVTIESALVAGGALVYSNIQTVTGPTTFNINGDADIYISCDPTLGVITVNCPNTTRSGTLFIIKDATGQAGANHITVTTPGGTVTFDGATTVSLSNAYSVLMVVYNGTTGNYDIMFTD